MGLPRGTRAAAWEREGIVAAQVLQPQGPKFKSQRLTLQPCDPGCHEPLGALVYSAMKWKEELWVLIMGVCEGLVGGQSPWSPSQEGTGVVAGTGDLAGLLSESLGTGTQIRGGQGTH